MVDIIKHLKTNYNTNIILNEDVIDELKHEVENNGINLFSEDVQIYTGDASTIRDKTDLIMTVGGDGTILNAVSKFLNANVPPILSFSMGTLGFLLPFNFDQYQDIIEKVFNNGSKVMKRSRLECHMISGANSEEMEAVETKKMVHAMNEITLHRGSNQNMITLEIFVDNEFLTTTTADGIIASTPTGSTAYSLSSGGAIVHPSIKGILLTPICPRSLSFRPLILPSNSDIMMRLSPKNRNISIKLNIDGVQQPDLKTGDEIHINKQMDLDNNIWCIARSENDWTKDINELLGFNKSFKDGKQRRID